MNPLTLLKAIDFRWYIIAALLAGLGLLHLDGQRVRGQRDKAIATHDKLVSDLAVANALANAREATATASAEAAKGVAAKRRSNAATASTKELDHAKETAPDWSAAPIPDGVRDALRSARSRSAQ